MAPSTPVPVPPVVLAGLGCDAITATRTPDPAALAPLLAQLAGEPCGHTWRTWLQSAGGADPVARVEAVLAREQAFRPTEVWTYRAVRDGAETPIAVATLSSRIRADFPHQGYPVLARAYVAPAARGHGLYRCLVQHRLERCAERWGDRLMAVHLGAADRPVERTLGRDDLGLRFVHVGDEELAVAGGRWQVRDYIAFTPRFRDRLPDTPRDLHDFVSAGCAAVPWGTLRPQLVGERSAAVVELLDLLDTIGVLP